MKLNKLAIITLTLVLISFILSLALGFPLARTPVLISSYVARYKMLSVLKAFFEVLPGVILTSFLVGLSLDFGESETGDDRRFAPAMFGRYKKVLIFSLATVLILTIIEEVIMPVMNTKMSKYAYLPQLSAEYKNHASTLYDNGKYALSYEFAKKALTLDPNDSGAKSIMERSEVAIDTEESTVTKLQRENEKRESLTEPVNKPATPNSPYTSRELLETARKYFDAKDYFAAHYYSELALSKLNTRDINYQTLKELSSDAWNKIEEVSEREKTAGNLLFKKKMEGYNALVSGDNLHAYYIFRTIYLSSTKHSLDPDIVRYLGISEERLKNDYFFNDETLNLERFESSNNTHFMIPNKLGGEDVYFIKGITNTRSGNSLIQYLRGFSIIHIDSKGKYQWGAYYPYAKMTSVKANLFDQSLRIRIGIDEKIKNVPYVLVNSVDRNTRENVGGAVKLKGENVHEEDGHIILPIEFSDYELIREASGEPESMNIDPLFKFIKIANRYGFSRDVYSQNLLNRVLFPSFFLICMIWVSIMSWQVRLPKGEYFKFKWIIVFPIFAVIFIFVYQLCFSLFKLLNYNILSGLSPVHSILAGLALYSFGFVMLTLVFLSCHESK